MDQRSHLKFYMTWFLPAAKPCRSRDDKKTVGGGGMALIFLLATFCQKWWYGSPGNILSILVCRDQRDIGCQGHEVIFYGPCRRRSIGPLPFYFASPSLIQVGFITESHCAQVT